VRILAVSCRYPPYVAGGYELSAAEAVDELRARGHEVAVLCARGARLEGPGMYPVLEPELDGTDPWQRALDAGNLEKVRRHMFDPSNHRRTKHVIGKVAPDLVFYFNLALVSVAPLLAAQAAGVPAVGEINDRWPLNHWLSAWQPGTKTTRRRALEAAWERLVRRVAWGPMLVPSESLARELRAHGHRVEVMPLPLPVDAARAARSERALARAPGEPLRVVATSMLWEGKGQHVLLEALAIARAGGARIELVLAGSGPADYRERLGERAARPDLAGAVHFAGLLERHAIGTLLARSHVFVLPSLWSEPYGLATLEAMAHALAPIVTDAGGSSEIVRHGVDGLVVPADDARALASALARLAADEAQRARLAASALARAEGDFAAPDYYDRLSARLERARAEARP